MARPKVAETPLELLNTPGLEPGVMNKFYNPVMGGVLGFTTVVLANWASRRPVWAGLQTHVISTVIGASVGYYIDERRNKHMAKRDAIFRNYIELHPEDFPPYERQQFKDVFEPWVPIR